METAGRRALGRPRRVDIDGVDEVARIAFRIELIGQLAEVAQDGLDARRCRVGAVEKLLAGRIEIEGVGLRIGVVDGVRRRRYGIAVAIAEEHLIRKAQRYAVRSGAA